MNLQGREHRIHQVFLWGVFLKLLDGILEILGAAALLFSGKITGLVDVLVQNELLEDPNDFVATHIQHFLLNLTSKAVLFAALYLFSHGIIKMFLAAGLLRNKLWAYPSAMVVFTLFVIYQIYRFAFTHSIFLLMLTVLDIVVIGLTWHEYHYFKKYHYLPK